ncbi:glycoside hydrolase family 16 protein [Neurospora crassa]|uniref:chitinase n=1 Tax=Neurospora crassa (strain ATCC 24698 / 74-OR23-1A / CBS 708.71 / DSM 1257 / FGSC 987) TaxID=367110 RepID=Q7SGL2_NEUCR|nr:cell wall glucanase [Neurospora crassa OR74A]EAA35967.1 cell wall glucanase [Neurospora crassa OR74A]KHE80656.1 glycoside hydrolase family 16 protein [Neurospora crassa]|eukprot:XP_965203.1 cell wall glucanase [Neurospora crassa OR74A]
MLLTRYLASATALLASSALAQITTDCQPLNKTCPADPALGMDYSWTFNSTPKAWAWETTVGTVDFDMDQGAAFTISKQGDSPTLRSKFYFFWGRTEIWMKAAQGRGIVSSVMFLSDDLDEIDWEFVGGEPNNVQTNTYGKGVIESSIPGKHDVSGNAQEDFHNYTTIWTRDYLDFYVDGNKVRTLLPAQANNTQFYPQTPMRLSFGIWAGGDPRMAKGTQDWAGGQTDYGAGPYTMHVKSVQVTDFSEGQEYVYGDRSGAWESIKVVEGNSTVKEMIMAPPKQSVSDKWNGMSSTTKTIIYACCAGVGALLLFAAVFVCIRTRRRGARQAALAEAQYQRDRLELEQLQKAGIDPDSFREQAAEYHADEMKKDGMATTTTYSVPPSPPLDDSNNTSGGQFNTASAVGAGVAAGAALGATGAAAASLSQSPRVASPAPAPGQQQQQQQHQQQFNSFDNNMNRVASPALSPGQQQQQFNFFDNNMNMDRVASPAPSIPALTPTIPNVTGGYQSQAHSPVFPPNRSFTSPVPGPYNPQGPMYGSDMNRVGSPAPGGGLVHPQPQRSFTAGPTAPGFASPQSASFDFSNNNNNHGGYANSPQASTFAGAYGQQPAGSGLGIQSGGAAAGYGHASGGVGQVPDFGLPGQNGFAEGRDSYWGDTRDDDHHNQGHMNNGGYR